MSSFFVKAISSMPRGEPWEDALADLLGEPKPMIVLKLIKLGLDVF